MIIYSLFGAGVETNAYNLAIQPPNLLFIFMTGGALSSTFIPVFTRLLDQDEEAAWKMASGTLLAVALGIAVFGAAISMLASPLVHVVLSRVNTSTETQDLTVRLLRVVMLQPLFLSLAVVATAVLQSFDKFTLPAFAPIAYNICIILGALVGGLWLPNSIGIFGVAYGVVIGSIVFLLMQIPLAARTGLRLPTSWPLSDPNIRRMFRLVFPRIVGQAAAQLNVVIALVLASGLYRDRGAALFSIANVLALIPVGLFGTSIATVTFPAMSREAIDQDLTRFKYLLRRSARSTLFLVLPAGLGMMLLREPIISLIYQHGKVGPTDVRLAAQAVLFFSLSVWAYALVDTFPRAFYALQDTKTPVRISVMTVTLDVVLSFILVRPFGLGGLALAFAIATILQVVLLAIMLTRRIGPFIDRDTITFLLKMLGCSAAMVVFLFLTEGWVDNWAVMPLIEKAIRLIALIVGAAVIYIGASALAKQDEISLVKRLILRRA